MSDYLLDLGYTREDWPAEWEDIGDAENGPMLDGHAAYTAYVCDEDTVYITEDGKAHYEPATKWPGYLEYLDQPSP